MKSNKNKIISIKTEHGDKLKYLIEVLKDVLHESPIKIIKGEGAIRQQIKKIEIKQEEQPAKRGRKPKNPSQKTPSPKIPLSKNVVSKMSCNDNDNDDENDSEDENEELNNKEDIEEIMNKTIIEQKENKKETKGGIKILTTNDNKTLILYVKMPSQNFLEFNCKYEEYDICFDLAQLYNHLRNINKDGILTIQIDEDDKQHIVFIVTNEKDNLDMSKYKLKLMDIDNKIIQIPPPDFDIKISMKTEAFHGICKEMVSIGDYIGILCTKTKLEFSCKGEVSELVKTFEIGNNVQITIASNKKDQTLIVKEIYDLRNLILFNKCVNLCDTIEILLKNKFPLFIKYTIASLGNMTVGFTPICETILNKNNNYPVNENSYDENNDKYYNEKDN